MIWPFASLMVTALPSASTTLPPAATLRFETVQFWVTTQLEAASTFTVMGLAVSVSLVAALLSEMTAYPVQVEPSVRLRSTELIVSASTTPESSWSMPVKVTVAPFFPALPQLLESLPAARMRLAFWLSKSSVVFSSTTFAAVFVR